MTAVPVKVELYGSNNDGGLRRYTIASDAAVVKGAICILSSPRTASVSGGASGSMVAGIAAEAHDGLDFSNSISVWTDGIFDIVASTAIAVGRAVIMDGNSVLAIDGATNASGAQILGYALKTAGAGDVINIRVRT